MRSRLLSPLLLALVLLPLQAHPAGAASTPTDPTPFASAGYACTPGHVSGLGCGAVAAYAQAPCSGCGTHFDIDLGLEWGTCASLTITERFSWGWNRTVPVAYASETCAGEAEGEAALFHYEKEFGNSAFLWTGEDGYVGFDPMYDFTLCVGARHAFSFTRECSTWTHQLYGPSNFT